MKKRGGKFWVLEEIHGFCVLRKRGTLKKGGLQEKTWGKPAAGGKPGENGVRLKKFNVKADLVNCKGTKSRKGLGEKIRGQRGQQRKAQILKSTSTGSAVIDRN